MSLERWAAGWIPSPPQWVKDPALSQPQHRLQPDLDLIPGLGTHMPWGSQNNFFFNLKIKKLFFFFLVFLPFLGPLPRQMEVPRLEVKLEL